MTNASLIPAVSGDSIQISGYGYTANIASIGATLRTLTCDGRDLVVPFDADEVRPFYRGAILAPWPNRVVDGAYTFNGHARQLSLTEPARGHALHGLAAWLDFAVARQTDTEVTLEADIVPQAGYPHRIRVGVTYSVRPDGLHTTVSGTNLGETAAPWGTGPHPYLVAGEGSVDDWELTLPAARVLTVTEERLIPLAVETIEDAQAGALDFRAPRVIGSTFIDHAFTELERDARGQASVIVRSPGGTATRMTWGAECGWVQVHTADQPEPSINRIGLAVEPMTCPPDAYNSGTDLVVLAPGQTHSAGWAIDNL